MGHYARGEIWIPAEDWIAWVKEWMPDSDGEWSLGPPTVRDGELVIPFAINTECHPKDEAVPPDWLKAK